MKEREGLLPLELPILALPPPAILRTHTSNSAIYLAWFVVPCAAAAARWHRLKGFSCPSVKLHARAPAPFSRGPVKSMRVAAPLSFFAASIRRRTVFMRRAPSLYVYDEIGVVFGLGDFCRDGFFIGGFVELIFMNIVYTIGFANYDSDELR